MKRVVTLLGLLGLAVVLGLFNGGALARDIVVDDDRVECPEAEFTTIQQAVNAADPGDTIRVCFGFYNEQVTVNKRLTIRGVDGPLVAPSNMQANTTSLQSGNPIAAAILVRDTVGVTIEQIGVYAIDNGILGCTPVLVGIFFRNASGTLEEVAVSNVRPRPGSESCDSGIGIFAQSGSSGRSEVNVTNCSVHDYQKNGITGNEVGTTLRVRQSVVTGLGFTGGVAPNGIQIGFGATGLIQGNLVNNNIWASCLDIKECPYVGVNVLVFDSNGVRVEDNHLGSAQRNVHVQGNNGVVNRNHVFNTTVFHGINLVGNGNQARNNVITSSFFAALFLRGNNNQVTRNRINEAVIGIWNFSGTGSTTTPNRIVNATFPTVVGPFSNSNSNDDDSTGIVPFR
jgi:hypothetical protein